MTDKTLAESARMTDEQLSSLEKKAKASQDVGSDFPWFTVDDLIRKDRFDERDAALVASLRPDTVLALVQEIRALRGLCERFSDAIVHDTLGIGVEATALLVIKRDYAALKGKR